MCYAREAVNGRFAQRAIDEQAVVMTHKSEGDYAYGFEYARVYNERTTELAFGFWGYAEGLRRDGYDDDNHADKCKAAGFGELLSVSSCYARVPGGATLEMSR